MGSKPHILFVHGNWGDHNSWDMVSRGLRAIGHPVTSLRMPDRGQSGVGQRNFREYVQVIVDESARVHAETGQRPLVFGHSLGATLALKAAEFGSIGGLVLAAPSPPTNIQHPLSFAEVRLFMPWLLRGALKRTLCYAYKPSIFAIRPLFRGWPLESIRQVHSLLHEDSGRILYEFLMRSADTQVDQKALDCPVLCIAGANDPVSPPLTVKQIAEWCRGDYLEIANASHFLIMEPLAVQQIIAAARRFFEYQESRLVATDAIEKIA